MITKGYYWERNKKKWKAQLRSNGKKIHIGYFENETDAKKAYLREKVLQTIINYGYQHLKL